MDHVTVSSVGILLSLYALYIEINKKKNPKYVAFCDLGDYMKCSRVLTSEYSRGFGLVRYMVGSESFLNLPNCILGIIFYSLQLVLGSLPGVAWASTVLYYTSIIAAVGSVYLAYVLFFVLRDLCLVCIATYCVNFVLLYLSHQRISA